MNKVIGYVGTRDLGGMRNADIRCLDVINIALDRWRIPGWYGMEAEQRKHWRKSAG